MANHPNRTKFPFTVSPASGQDAKFRDDRDAQLFASIKSATEKTAVEVYAPDGIIGQYRDGKPTVEFVGRGDEVYAKDVAGIISLSGSPLIHLYGLELAGLLPALKRTLRSARCTSERQINRLQDSINRIVDLGSDFARADVLSEMLDKECKHFREINRLIDLVGGVSEKEEEDDAR